MIEFVVSDKEDGMRLERAITSLFPAIPVSRVYKALRKRDVRIDGTRISSSVILRSGQSVMAYINNDDDASSTNHRSSSASVEIVYENDYILLVNKPQGLLSVPDDSGEESLPDVLRRMGMEAEPCHRLDRNTGGLIFFSKQPQYTEGISEALTARYYDKVYSAVVVGDARDICPTDGSMRTFKAYHFKDSRSGRVYIYNDKRKLCREIETRFGFRSYDKEKDISHISAQLITGRTHQIRAHIAFLGHHIAGDGKYGREEANKRLGYKHQALWASEYKPSDSYNGRKDILGIPIETLLPKTTFTL